MLKTIGGSLLTVALAACGPAVSAEEAAAEETADEETAAEPTCDPWAEVCEVSLRPNWDASAVLDLEAATVTAEPTGDAAEALRDGQVRASVGRYLALQSEHAEPLLCLLPEPFPRLDDVPTDASACDCEALAGCWVPSTLFSLLGTEGAEFDDMGLLLKTRSGDLYRARVLEADSSLDPSTLTIEYEGVM